MELRQNRFWAIVFPMLLRAQIYEIYGCISNSPCVRTRAAKIECLTESQLGDKLEWNSNRLLNFHKFLGKLKTIISGDSGNVGSLLQVRNIESDKIEGLPEHHLFYQLSRGVEEL